MPLLRLTTVLATFRLTALLAAFSMAAAAFAEPEDVRQRLLERVRVDPAPLDREPVTTVVEGPLRDDGTIDYVAAVNARLSQGVTPDNNAYAVIAALIHPSDWDDDDYRERVFEEMGVPLPDDDAEYLRSFRDYVVQQTGEYLRHNSELYASWDLAMREPWSAEAAPVVADWLAAQEGPLSRLGEALDRERFWAPFVPDSSNHGLIYLPGTLGALQDRTYARSVVGYDPPAAPPRLGTLRRALPTRALLRIEQGGLADAAADVLTLERLARAVTAHELLMEQMAISASTRRPLAHLAGHDALTAAHARALLDELPDAPMWPHLSRAIATGERHMLLNFLQRLSEGFDDSTLTRRLPFADRAWVAEVGPRYFDLDRAIRRANRHYDRLAEVGLLNTRHEREQAWTDAAQHVEATLSLLPRDRIRATHVMQAELLRRTQPERVELFTDVVTDYLVRWLQRPIGGARNTVERPETFNVLKRVALAVAGHRAEHGVYPAALDQLVPGWLDTVPDDPFAAEPGQAIIYRVEDDRVVIYSVGDNGEDNGGVSGPYRDLALEWPR